MPTPLAFMGPLMGAATGGGSFLASAGGAATIDLLSGLLGGVFGGMGQKQQMNQAMEMWRKMAKMKEAGLQKIKPKTPYSEWYAGKAAPMSDYLQNILTQTMQQRGIG